MAFSQTAGLAFALAVTIATSLLLRRMLRKRPKAIWPIATVVITLLAVAIVLAISRH